MAEIHPVNRARRLQCGADYLVWSYEPEFSQIDTSLEGTTNISQGERVTFEKVMSTYQLVWIQGENNTRGTTDPRALIGIREHLDGSNVTSMNVYNSINRLNVRGEESGEEEFLRSITTRPAV